MSLRRARSWISPTYGIYGGYDSLLTREDKPLDHVRIPKDIGQQLANRGYVTAIGGFCESPEAAVVAREEERREEERRHEERIAIQRRIERVRAARTRDEIEATELEKDIIRFVDDWL